jgi:hypothetical protein
MTTRKKFIAVFLGMAFAVGHALAAQGPSSSATPYLVTIQPGVEFTSILTVGDSVKMKHKGNETYRMAGIPDGLGAFDNGDGTITVLMNHELAATSGVPRAHGGKGAFVSKWQIRKSDLKVLNGEDLIKTVKLWDATVQSFVETPGVVFNRFCSGDLPLPTAFYNSKSGVGFSDGRIYMNGEETAGGLAVAHIVAGREHGTSYELPSFGRVAWENVVANPYEQDKTVVVGMDDTTPSSGNAGGKVYVYVGQKQDHGGPIEEAGLQGGNLYTIGVAGIAAEDRANGIAAGTRFSLVAPASGTQFLRPEDGSWDTVNPNRFYFATTDRYDQVKDGVGAQVGRSRLWRLTFDSIENPQAGGSIEMMLDGTEAGNMYDNITVDSAGNVILQEDVGNQQHLGKIFKYDPTTHGLTLIGQHDPARFGDIGIPAAAGFNQDEESSGVIEVTDLFVGVDGYETGLYRYFLLDVQAHFNISATDPELVEKGQFLMMRTWK